MKKNKDSRRRVVAYINLVIKVRPNQAQVFNVQLSYKLNPPINSLNLGIQIISQPAFAWTSDCCDNTRKQQNQVGK